MVFVFLCLIYLKLSMTISGPTHVDVNGFISFFLLLSNIPLCVCVCVCVCMYVYIHIYDIFFIHSTVNGHLGCLYVSAIVNTAAMHRGACIFLNYSFIWIYAQEWNYWIVS